MHYKEVREIELRREHLDVRNVDISNKVRFYVEAKILHIYL